MAYIDKICLICEEEYSYNDGTIIRECQKCFQEKPLKGIKYSDLNIEYDYFLNDKIKKGKRFWYWGDDGKLAPHYFEEDIVVYHGCVTWNVHHGEQYIGYWKCKHSMKKSLRKMGVRI